MDHAELVRLIVEAGIAFRYDNIKTQEVFQSQSKSKPDLLPREVTVNFVELTLYEV